MTKDEALKLARDWIAERPADRPVSAGKMISIIDRALAQPAQEPVAWHTEDHLTDRSATTYRKDMVYSWECKGWPVTPLYTSPSKEQQSCDKRQPPKRATIEDAPGCLNTNDKAMWVIGWNECLEAYATGGKT